jgi:hypothetical protein
MGMHDIPYTAAAAACIARATWVDGETARIEQARARA